MPLKPGASADVAGPENVEPGKDGAIKAHETADEEERDELPETPVLVVRHLKEDNLPASKGVEDLESCDGNQRCPERPRGRETGMSLARRRIPPLSWLTST
jgi:hypothetical protein